MTMESHQASNTNALQQQHKSKYLHLSYGAKLLASVNLLGLLLAVPILVIGSLLQSNRNVHCITFIEIPMLAIGIVLALVSIAGILAAFWGLQWLLWIHLVALFLLVILLFCFAVFTVDITGGGSGHPVPGTSYSEYVLSDYPKWMRHRVERKREWNHAVECLKRNGLCSSLLPYTGTDRSLYDQSPLSAAQSGCCKPPLACSSTYVNATDWITPSTPGASLDCGIWNNDPSLLCYQCSSCKAALIQTTKDRWHIKVGVTFFVVLIVLVTSYAILGCLTFRQETRHSS